MNNKLKIILFFLFLVFAYFFVNSDFLSDLDDFSFFYKSGVLKYDLIFSDKTHILDLELRNIKYELLVFFMIILILFLVSLFCSCFCNKYTKYRSDKAYYEGVCNKANIISDYIQKGVCADLILLSEKINNDSEYSVYYVELLRILDELKTISCKSLFYDKIHDVCFSDLLCKSVMLDKINILMNLDICIHPDFENIDSNKKLHFVRITQELLSNSMKYSFAKKISVNFNIVYGKYVLEYSDDGLGFDLSSVSHGIGLDNIRARTIELNGNISIITSPNRGFYMKIIV